MTLNIDGTICLVGAGKMGMAIVRGWLAAGIAPEQMMLFHPSPSERTRQTAQEYGLALATETLASEPRVVIMAVKPQMMSSVYAHVRPMVGADTLILSIVAGTSIAAMSEGLGTARVIRTMPNVPAQVGKGVTGLFARSDVGESDRELSSALLGAAGKIVWLDAERDIDALTAVSGSGPAYVFLMVEAMAAAGVEQGLQPEQAMLLARQTIIGAAALMEADPADVSVLRQNVTSKAGTTAAALDVLMADDGLSALMSRAIDAARRRSEELGK